MIRLGVNIDHVATIREARKTNEPDPVYAAFLAEHGGADQITIHLREDRRHIQDRDLHLLRQTVKTRLNLEMALSDEIVELALAVKPDQVTFVPEKREEITTEGGLDVAAHMERLEKIVPQFKSERIVVSLFIDPDAEAIQASGDLGVDSVELHTGRYANASSFQKDDELRVLCAAGEQANGIGLSVNAGHGLTYTNTHPILRIPHLEELNIGHSIVSRAVISGMVEAVREMRKILDTGNL